MKGRIKTEVAKQRSKELTNLCKEISYLNNKSQVGKKFNILITEVGKNNTFVGRSDNYKPVVVKEEVKLGLFYDVKTIDAKPTYLVARLI